MSSFTHWCHGCSRLVMITNQNEVICVSCHGGFVEQIENAVHTVGRNGGYFSGTTYLGQSLNLGQNVIQLIRRLGRNSGSPSYFHPLIVLHPDGGDRWDLQLFYYDDDSSGIMPLPRNSSELVLCSRVGTLLERIAQRETNGTAELEAPPASKAAIEAIPTIEIGQHHLQEDSCCAICMEKFKLEDQARELPCKHNYHSDCILPWLSIRSSCPVCRHRLPADSPGSNTVPNPELWRLPPENGEPNLSLIVWRLPGGGFATERVPGRNSLENHLPGVRREAGNNGGDGWRSGWSRVFCNMLTCFGISSNGSQASRRRRRRRTRSMEDDNGISSRW